MSADREAPKHQLDREVLTRIATSPVRELTYIQTARLKLEAKTCLEELEAAEAEARDAEWLRGQLVAVRVGAEAERDRLRDLCHRAWIALEIYEPDGPLTSELYAALESERQ